MKPTFALALAGQGNNPVLDGDTKFIVTPGASAVKYRDDLLAKSGFIEAVTDIVTQTQATNAAALLKALLNESEKARKAIKAPFLAGGKTIDASIAEFTKDAEAELKRLEGLLAEHHRKETERAAAIRAEQDAAAEVIREQAAWDGETPFFPAEAYQEPPKVAGAAVKGDWDIAVTDIHAFYAWNRAFVRMEIDTQLLKGYLNIPSTDPTQIPGVTATRKTRVEVRAAKPE